MVFLPLILGLYVNTINTTLSPTECNPIQDADYRQPVVTVKQSRDYGEYHGRYVNGRYQRGLKRESVMSQEFPYISYVKIGNAVSSESGVIVFVSSWTLSQILLQKTTDEWSFGDMMEGLTYRAFQYSTILYPTELTGIPEVDGSVQCMMLQVAEPRSNSEAIIYKDKESAEKVCRCCVANACKLGTVHDLYKECEKTVEDLLTLQYWMRAIDNPISKKVFGEQCAPLTHADNNEIKLFLDQYASRILALPITINGKAPAVRETLVKISKNGFTEALSDKTKELQQLVDHLCNLASPEYTSNARLILQMLKERVVFGYYCQVNIPFDHFGVIEDRFSTGTCLVREEIYNKLKAASADYDKTGITCDATTQGILILDSNILIFSLAALVNLSEAEYKKHRPVLATACKDYASEMAAELNVLDATA